MLGMDLFQHRSGGSSRSRSRCREKPPHRASGERNVVAPDLRSRSGDHLFPMERARGEGNNQIRKRVTASKAASDCGISFPTEENSFAFEFSRGSHKKASGTPIKMLIDEDMSKEMAFGQPSPSVIAKLMGLDTLPPQQLVYKHKNEQVTCFREASSQGYREQQVSYKDRSSVMGTKEQQEFKDVFEVLETAKAAKPQNRPVQKGLSNAKQSDKEIAFIRQKFIDAKRLSTDENLQNSKEFSDALEVLDSNKDIFLKFLQEPSSLFTKHLLDLHSVPGTPPASHITILKSSHIAKYENNQICWQSERKTERRAQMQDVLRKYETDLISHSIKAHTGSLSHKLSKSKSEGKTEAYFLPTRIVVLKPSLEKVQKTAKMLSTPESFQLGYKRHRDFRRSGNRELFSEVRERQKLSKNVEVVRHRTKVSREIAKEITEHMRQTVSSGSVKLGSGCSGYPRHENSRGLSGKAILMDYEAQRRISGHLDDWNKSYNSSFSTETSVSREARKRLSERWMMTHRLQEEELIGRGSSTLGEMLALSDREMPYMPLDSSGQKGSDDKLATKEALTRWDSPLGISSRDGWKDGFSRSLPRSKSLPSSSTIYGSPKPSSRHGTGLSDNCVLLKDVLNVNSSKSSEGNLFNQRLSSSGRNVKIGCNKSPPSDPVGVKNKHPAKEIHVNQNELQNRICLRNFSEGKPVPSEPLSSSSSDTRYPVDLMTIDYCGNSEMPSVTNEEQLPQSVGSNAPVEDEDSVDNDQKEMIAKEMSPDHPQVELVSSHSHVMGQASSLGTKEGEQPSPVSVLEPPDEHESSPECFERVSADLQDLRMQLQLLRLESTDTYSEGSVVLTEEDAAGDCDALPQIGEIPRTFRDEEDRDLSYLLNVLTDSGFHNADWDMLLASCHSPESPVDQNVFEKLENMFSQVAWSRTERKLLFDLINSVLAEIIAPSVDLHPWVKPRMVGLIGCHKFLTEEVWQSLVRRLKETSGNPADKVLERDQRWLDLGDDIDVVGRTIERMLKDELLEEFVSEIIFQ